MQFKYDFTRIDSRASLLDALGIDDETFQRVIDFIPPPPAWDRPPTVSKAIIVLELPVFLRHDIPKKKRGRGHRTVWEALPTKNIHKALARRLDNFFRWSYAGYPSESAFGYRAGRNIRENAQRHSGHKYLLNADIEDFFPSITTSDVGDLLKKVGMVPNVAELLARFVTIGGSLPLGLSTSPTISNAIALPIDQALAQLSACHDVTYSRYSDDMSFSGNGVLPPITEIEQIINDHGFRLAQGKTRTSTKGQGHYVTGLSISDPHYPRVPKAKKRKLRQELYYASKFGLDNHFRHMGINDRKVIQREINRLDGMVKFVAHHEPTLRQIKQSWRAILLANDARPSFPPRSHGNAPFFIYIDEAEYRREDKPVLALCLVVTQHVEKVVDDTVRVLAGATSDMWADGSAEILRKRGLHFTDATQDLRLTYNKALARMPFEAYVAYREYDGPSVYEETYLSLLSALISRRLMAAESQFAFLRFEQNSKVSSAKITRMVEGALAELKMRDNRRPVAVKVDIVGKPNPMLSPPDFLLGFLGHYLAAKPVADTAPVPRERLMFERLRDKYRLVFDLSAGVEYSRRRPLVPWCEQFS